MYYLFSSLRGMGIVQIRASARIAHWVPIPATSLPFHRPAGHVGRLGSLPLFLGVPSPLASSIPLILSMGLLAVIPIMLAHWTCYLFSQASSAHLLRLYLSFSPWAYQLLFLPCRPIGLVTSFLGLPQLTYFVFIFYSSHEPVGYYSCHVGPLGLQTCFFLSSSSSSFFFFFSYCWASFTFGHFIKKKNGHQHSPSLSTSSFSLYSSSLHHLFATDPHFSLSSLNISFFFLFISHFSTQHSCSLFLSLRYGCMRSSS